MVLECKIYNVRAWVFLEARGGTKMGMGWWCKVFLLILWGVMVGCEMPLFNDEL